jgi:cytochrome c-type biogenesis protein CcmF
MFLLLLTALGPLLAWRKTSFDSLKRNFLIPSLVSLVVAIALVIGGMKPWEDVSVLYSLMGITLSVLVAATIISEFWRGGRVIARHNDSNVFAGMLQLTRRNTRRYGGYLVHMGVVFAVIGFAGAAFNQDKEQELGFGDKMQIGGYTLVCQSFTQDDKPNYSSEWAIIDVYRGNEKIATMFPERRVYKASDQPATMVANRSTLREDLYLVYTGNNPQTNRPILKAHLNPLVMWIWIGAFTILFGTIIALVPNMAASAIPSGNRERARAVAEVEKTGTAVGAGD